MTQLWKADLDSEMDGIRRITVNPGISPSRMKRVWEMAVQEVTQDPGKTVAILFAPGEYPLPNTGMFIYSETPTILQVPEPGTEIRFIYDPGIDEVSISTHQIGHLKRN
jgi:hypothetical protein